MSPKKQSYDEWCEKNFHSFVQRTHGGRGKQRAMVPPRESSSIASASHCWAAAASTATSSADPSLPRDKLSWADISHNPGEEGLPSHCWPAAASTATSSAYPSLPIDKLSQAVISDNPEEEGGPLFGQQGSCAPNTEGGPVLGQQGGFTEIGVPWICSDMVDEDPSPVALPRRWPSVFGLAPEEIVAPRTSRTQLAAECRLRDTSASLAEVPITTLMLCDIPCSILHSDLVATLDAEGFAGKYDSVHVPMVAGRRSNLGYCFISFVDSATASCFSARFSGRRFPGSKSTKLCSVKAAHSQTRGANSRSLLKRQGA
jgi:hypothetical protein